METTQTKQKPIAADAKAKLIAALQRKLSKGEKVGARGLENLYGREAGAILLQMEAITELPRKKGRPTQYKKGKKQLPSFGEFCIRRTAAFTVDVETAIGSAFGTLEELASECREIYDNASEGLQQTSRIQTFEQTADALEGLCQPDIPAHASKVTFVSFPDRSGRTGRSHRCEEAADELQSCVDAINDYVQEQRDKKPGEDAVTEDDLSDLESLAMELESAIGDAQGAEFPGMYG